MDNILFYKCYSTLYTSVIYGSVYFVEMVLCAIVALACVSGR